MNVIDTDIIVNITGLKCPVPLIEARKAIKATARGKIIKFTGSKNEEVSRREILMALENLGQPVVDTFIDSETSNWYILIKRE